MSKNKFYISGSYPTSDLIALLKYFKYKGVQINSRTELVRLAIKATVLMIEDKEDIPVEVRTVTDLDKERAEEILTLIDRTDASIENTLRELSDTL
jgi:hypothetical protein